MDLDLFEGFSTVPAAASVTSAFEAGRDISLDNSLRKRQRAAAEEHDEEERDDKSRKTAVAGFGATPSSTSTTAAATAAAVAAAENDATAEQKPPARVYKFKLDPFQQEAVNHIERGESVLVAAHTSAGKTAVAEYAIAKSLRDKQRVIYTSPIKALSNQKYRDLQEEFGDVGLMTGDMTINPNASCLIMTTEILRSMLYRGSEVVREVAWVVYDEVHYMRDKERGVVWEESIILLPHKVRFVFLSATIPNAPAFVDWVSKIHHQPCHVVYTDYRPVPLQHYLFPANAEGLYLVVDEKSKFREENFQKAMASLQPNALGEFDGGGENGAGQKKGFQKKTTKNIHADLTKIVNLIMTRQLDPCIVFSFSKKDCETYAMLMARMEFNNEEEKALIEKVFNNAIEGLSEDDKSLPQINTLLPLLKRGIGVHHGGLLPILKEVIEILFQEGLIKCLFATETFSIGINMPAKTVVFTSTRKFDGKDFRWVTSGEYIQMSGRAGRRGKDDKGIVIQMIDEKMSPDVAKNMIYGASDPLYSAYHLGYNMVLNMLRVEGADPLHVIKNSFLQFQQEIDAPKLLRQAEEIEREVVFFSQQHAAQLTPQNEQALTRYLDTERLTHEIDREIAAIISQPAHCLPFLQGGRLVRVHYQGKDFGWAVITQLRKHDGKSSFKRENFVGKLGPKGSFAGEYVLDALCEVRLKTESEREKEKEKEEEEKQENQVRKNDIFNRSSQPELMEEEREREREREKARFLRSLGFAPIAVNESDNNAQTELRLLQVSLDGMHSLSAVRLNLASSLTAAAGREKEREKEKVRKALKEVKKRFSEAGVPLLDARSDMGIDSPKLDALLTQQAALREREKTESPNWSVAERDTLMALYTAKQSLLRKAHSLRVKADSLQSVTMREDLKRMKRVLRKLDFVTAEGVLTSKGRFACEVSAADELLVTSLVFTGAFNELSIDQAVALLSVFVNAEGGASNSASGADNGPDLSKVTRGDMHKPLRVLHSMAREISKVLVEHKLLQDAEEYVKSFDATLVDVAFAWSNGAKFSELCRMTDVFEGSIIRSLRRLEELLRQLAAASVAIGNQELVTLFTEGAQKIRRGVVFAASLYI